METIKEWRQRYVDWVTEKSFPRRQPVIKRIFKIPQFILPDLPLRPFRQFLVDWRGTDWSQAYFWITKDLAWVMAMGAWEYIAYVFGACALFIAVLQIGHSLHARCATELLFSVASFLWVFGNYWWLVAEVSDLNALGEWGPNYDQHTLDTQKILMSGFALCWFYYLIIRPFGIFEGKTPIPINDRTNVMYTSYTRLYVRPRFRFFFRNFREYENIHIMCWLGKDMSWSWGWPWVWVAFVIPTLLLSMDYIYITLCRRGKIIYNLHFWMYLAWLVGNFTWALGELFYIDFTDPTTPQGLGADPTYHNFRWYSAWALICAYIPMGLVFVIWIPTTLAGKTLPKPRLCDFENGMGPENEGPNSVLSLVSAREEGAKTEFE